MEKLLNKIILLVLLGSSIKAMDTDDQAFTLYDESFQEITFNQSPDEDSGFETNHATNDCYYQPETYPQENQELFEFNGMDTDINYINDKADNQLLHNTNETQPRNNKFQQNNDDEIVPEPSQKKRKCEYLNNLKKYYYFCPKCNYLIQIDSTWGNFKNSFIYHFTRYTDCRKTLAVKDLVAYLEKNKKTFINKEAFNNKFNNSRFKHPCIVKNCQKPFPFCAKNFLYLHKSITYHCSTFHPHISEEDIHKRLERKYPNEVAHLRNYRNIRKQALHQKTIEQSDSIEDEK